MVLAVTVSLIIYGSLYPFVFKAPGSVLLGWPRRATTSDVLINFLLYIPIGTLGWFAIARCRAAMLRATGIVLGAAVLSGGIEITQAFDAGRHSSALDVIMNAVGAVAGIGFAVALRHAPFWNRLPRDSGVGSALFVLGLWACWRLAPFLADFSGASIPGAFASFRSDWRPEPLALFTFTIHWLVVMHLVAALGSPRAVIARAALIVVAIGCLRAWIPGKSITPHELYGFALAAGLWALGLRQALVAAVLLGAHFAYFGTQPQGGAPPRPFNWLPFRSFIRHASEPAIQVLLGHLFAACVFAWLLARSGLGYRGALPIGLGLSIGIEWAQTGVPGRTPDITDPTIYVVSVLALARMETLVLPTGRPTPMPVNS